MLTSIGRASARRILAQRLPAQLSFAARAIRPTAPARCFSVSQWARLPTATKKAPDTTKPKAKKAAAATTASKATKTTKAATKATTGSKTKKPAAKKPATKTKAKAKAKPAPKKKKAKKLTPEEKERKVVRQLKEQALFTEPTNLPENVWTVFTVQNVKKGDLRSQMTGIAQEFRSLSGQTRDSLQQTGEANRLTNRANYKAWVESHPPEIVWLANSARRRLARRNATKKAIRPIRDERLPKRPGGPYSVFVKARYAHLDSHNAVETMRALSQEWKKLSEAERRPYADVTAQESVKYKEQLDALRAKVKAAQDAVKTAQDAAKA